MAENLEKMNVETAVEIIKSGIKGARFEAAVQFLQLYQPDNEVLKAFEQEQKEEAKKPATDKTPKPVKDETSEEIKKQVKAALDAMSKDKNEREILGEEKQDLKNDNKVAENLNGISDIFDNEEFKKRLNMMMNRDTVHVSVDNSGNILGEGEGKTSEQIEQEKQSRKAILSEALEAAKQEVLMFYGRDKKFASMDENQKRKVLEDSVADVFNFKMAKATAASAVKEPTAEEAMPNTKQSEDYQKKALADMRAALEAFYNKKPITVKPEHILSSTVNTSQAMDEYEADMRKAKLNKSAQVFNEKKEEYNEARRSFWGKAFDMAKGVWKGIKQNKARIITDAAVVMGAGVGASSLGVAGLTTLGVSAVAAPVAAPIAAAAVMGAYFAVGSFAWLVNDERRNQKAKAEDKAKWSGFNGLKNAWNSIMSDKQKKSKFLRQGSITATAGVAGAALFGAAASTMGLAYGRIASGAARSLGSVTSQGANWAVAANEFKKYATEENKAARNSARTGFYTSAAFAVLASAVGAYFGLNHDADLTSSGHTTDNVDGITGADTGHTGKPLSDVITDKSTGAQGADGTGTDAVTASTVEVPTEWNADMGISEDHWNEMMEKITGVYREHADIFGQKNVSSEAALKNMYQNIENARGAGYFEGQTNEEVLYKYMKLIEQTERAEPLEGTDYLVTKLDANKNPMYWVNAKEMMALNKIIICNEKVDVPSDKIKDVMDLINEEGQYTGEGADIGVTNNRYAGGKYGCDENQNAWKKGSNYQPTPKPNSNPEPKPEPKPVEVNEKTIDNKQHEAPLENTSETTVDEHKETQSYKLKWEKRSSTGQENTIDAESKLPPKVKDHGTISIPVDNSRGM